MLRSHLDGHGRPVAVYSDKHGVFRVNHREREGELTQFGRALRTLDIEPIHAGSPQAKGRVERANGTLQDRLVKEMRLRGIDGMEAGNAFLPEFMEDHNRRFAVEPLCPADAHRPVLRDAAELGPILSPHSTRKVSRSLTLHYRGRERQIQVRGQGYGLRGARVTVCEGFDGRVAIVRDRRPLGNGKQGRGHFNFGEKGTFLLWFDTPLKKYWTPPQHTASLRSHAATARDLRFAHQPINHKWR